MTQQQTYWWTGTRLDFSSIGEANEKALASLAVNQENFYNKYVSPPNLELLQNDVQYALRTTPEYAGDFAGKVIEYFKQNPPPTPASSGNTLLSPQTNSDEPATRDEFLHSVEAMKQTSAQFTQQKSQELNAYITKEVQAMRDEIQEALQLQRTLEDSFAQMRLFMDDFMRRNQPQGPPVYPQQPQPPPTTSAVITAGPIYPPTQPPPQQQQQQQQQTEYERQLQQMQDEEYANFASQQSNAENILPTLNFVFSSKNIIKDQTVLSTKAADAPGVVPGQPATTKTLRWNEKKRAVALMDHTLVDGVVQVTIQPFLGKSGLFTDTDIKFGFQEDNFTDSTSPEDTKKVYYKSNGKLHIKSATEKVQTFGTGDTMMIECNMTTRVCIIFKNNEPLPIRITKIPRVIKFFIEAEAPGTQIDILGFCTKDKPMDISRYPVQSWNTIDMSTFA